MTGRTSERRNQLLRLHSTFHTLPLFHLSASNLLVYPRKKYAIMEIHLNKRRPFVVFDNNTLSPTNALRTDQRARLCL